MVWASSAELSCRNRHKSNRRGIAGVGFPLSEFRSQGVKKGGLLRDVPNLR
jgi:hypothetical protein